LEDVLYCVSRSDDVQVAKGSGLDGGRLDQEHEARECGQHNTQYDQCAQSSIGNELVSFAFHKFTHPVYLGTAEEVSSSSI
jgi:hypothetical protein